ncbi:MAG TPA: dephospho-CoA kinase [Candidatus Limnocylindrales bacterium]|nr:dephospho-CoA kinase [Candidatus Limnocylindrales bacterium]
MTLRIGITGPIGCGKSTVAGWLGELGATVIDADRIARDVVEPGEPAFEAVLAAFGSGVRSADGELDRAALGRLVFADPAALRRLEAIVHPAVRPRILAALVAAEAAGEPATVIEAIKLVEGGLADLCDEVWLVTCDPAAQRARVMARGAEAADADARIRAQGDLAARLRPAASRVVDTSGSLAATRAEVAAAYAEALTAGGRQAGPTDSR